MKQLKCESCGANLEADESSEYIKCPYCKAEYKLRDDKNINININDNTKETINNGIDSAKKISIVGIIAFVVIVIAIFSLVVFFVVKSFTAFSKSANTATDTFDSIIDKAEEEIENKDSKFKIDSFNNKFEMYSGTNSAFFVSALLDSVVTNNKKNSDKLVTVTYGDKTTTNTDEIIEIKHSLNNDGKTKYEVEFEYDDKGYINKVTISEL